MTCFNLSAHFGWEAGVCFEQTEKKGFKTCALRRGDKIRQRRQETLHSSSSLSRISVIKKRKIRDDLQKEKNLPGGRVVDSPICKINKTDIHIKVECLNIQNTFISRRLVLYIFLKYKGTLQRQESLPSVFWGSTLKHFEF